MNPAFLLPVLFGLAASAAARDRWPEAPMGATSAAFGGGGGAAPGLDALFVNPAALEIRGGVQTELGLMGLSEGISPYALFGAQVAAPPGASAGASGVRAPWAGGTSYAVGYFFDRRDGLTASKASRQGLIGGGSWTVYQGDPRDFLRTLTLGAAAHTFGTERTFGVDFDAGARLRARGGLSLGVAAAHVLESGVGYPPEGYDTRRRWLVSAGATARRFHIWKFGIREPGVAYEMRAADFPPEGFVHGFSAGASFIQDGVLGLRASALLPQAGTAYLAGGLSLRLPVGPGMLTCRYSAATGYGRADDTPTHSIAFNLSSIGRADRLAPAVSVQADRPLLSDADSAFLHFRISASDRLPPGEDGSAGESGEAMGRLREWVLSIHATLADGRAGDAVKAFEGKDLPPRIIRWDGRGEAGSELPPGYYAFRLSAKDESGNQGVTAWQLLELAAAPPGAAENPPATAPPAPGPPARPAAGDSLDLGAPR